MASMATGLQNAAPSESPDKQQSAPATPKRVKWVPTFSFRLWRFQLWAGKEITDGRAVYLLAEERQQPQISLSFHWLTDETPMFGLYLFPVCVAYAFWAHSHDITKEAE